MTKNNTEIVIFMVVTAILWLPLALILFCVRASIFISREWYEKIFIKEA